MSAFGLIPVGRSLHMDGMGVYGGMGYWAKFVKNGRSKCLRNIVLLLLLSSKPLSSSYNRTMRIEINTHRGSMQFENFQSMSCLRCNSQAPSYAEPHRARLAGRGGPQHSPRKFIGLFHPSCDGPAVHRQPSEEPCRVAEGRHGRPNHNYFQCL